MRFGKPTFTLAVIVLAVLLAALAAAPARAQNVLSAQQWRENLQFLADQIVKVHPGAFHDISEQDFRSAVTRLNARIPMLSDHEVEVEFVRLVASLKEGHSRFSLPGLPDPMSDVPDITPSKDARLAFSRFPIRLYAFADGLYVIAATPELHSLVGSKVLQIGGRPAQTVVDAVQPLANRDNDVGALLIAPDLVTVPEVLQSLHVTANPGPAAFTFLTKDGKALNLDIAPLPPGSEPRWVGIEADWSVPVPLYRRHSSKNLWAEYLAKSKIVYVKINVLQDSGDETVARFARRVSLLIDSNPANRFVIDLRGCHGGDNRKFRALLLEFIRNAKLNQLGKLFVIIDRGTFSAAVNAAGDLERLTNSILVGEPTAGAPGSWGDPMAIALPNGGLIARISTTYWSDWMPGPPRRSIAPDIQTPSSSADYFAGRDPAMDTIVRFPEITQYGDVLGHLLRVGAGTNTIERLYYQRKTDPVWADASTEQSMQRIGAQLVSAKSYKDALLVFEINFRDYPSSLRSALQAVRLAQASNRHDAGLDDLANTLSHLKLPPQRH